MGGVVLLGSLWSCSHGLKKGDSDSSGSSAKAGKKVKTYSPFAPEWFLETPPDLAQEKMEVLGVELRDSRFDLPVVVNSHVERWVDYFNGRGRRYFEVYLRRSEFFIPYLAELLKKNNMPRDLVYLAMIESGFSNHARSRARAVGPWQFMRGTGRRYGLVVNWWVDQRVDIEKSTRAAIHYLKDLYDVFGSWELAAAAYNAGEARVARAIETFGTRDIWTLIRQRHLKPETRNYVAKMMAAAVIDKNRKLFGFPDRFDPAEDVEGTLADTELKEEESDPTHQDMREEKVATEQIENAVVNPEETGVVEGGPPAAVLVAEDESDTSADSDDDDDEKDGVTASLNKNLGDRFGAIAIPHVSRKGEVSGEDVVEFEIQSPADLFKVAQAAGLVYDKVKKLNPELLRWCTPPMFETYRVRLPKAVKQKFLVNYNHPTFARGIEFRSYEVRNGDTLKSIGRRFGVAIEPLQDLNGLGKHTNLRNGQKILLPFPKDRQIATTSKLRQKRVLYPAVSRR